jgi:hypothetical protein
VCAAGPVSGCEKTKFPPHRITIRRLNSRAIIPERRIEQEKTDRKRKGDQGDGASREEEAFFVALSEAESFIVLRKFQTGETKRNETKTFW